MRRATVVLAALALSSCSVLQWGDSDAPSAAKSSPSIAIADSWASVAPNGANQAAGFLTISNAADTDDRLVSVSSPRAARMEVHEMAMEGSMTTMRHLDHGIVVPAHASVALKPSGNHLMFIGLTTPLRAGETVPVTLTFEKAGTVQAELPIRTMGAMR